MAPSNENELRHMIVTALKHDGPIALRYPRGSGEGVRTSESLRPLPIGKAEILTTGEDVLILAVGWPVNEALKARQVLAEEGIAATVVNCRFIKPLDADLIAALAEKIPRIVTVEENVLAGGFGSAVIECLSDLGLSGCLFRRIGIADTFVEHGSQKLLRSKYGIDAPAIVEAARQLTATAELRFRHAV
jgi:1-deoxy-D-xylulose-5-phosphate synthase